MAFSKEYQEKKNEVENYIFDMLTTTADFPEPLHSAVAYSINGGGKRLRPILFLEIYRVFCGEITESVIKIATAIECIHTYSLIHDDLPCMDNDDFRRGKPTNHKVYGEANAVLAGDSLLNFAYQLMFDAIILAENKELTVRACKIIADAAGGSGLIGGQTLDLMPSDEVSKPGKLSYIYQHKTSDLISASMVAGSVLGGATLDEQACVKGYGDYFGLSFQIKDDILDAEDKGDIDKNTYVHVYGIVNSKSALMDCIEKAILHLSYLNKETTFLKKLALKFADRKE